MSCTAPTGNVLNEISVLNFEVVQFLVGPGDRSCTDLRSGEGVAIAVARHLASAADIMVADGLPPDDGNGVVQGVYVVVHSPYVDLQLQLLQSRVCGCV